MLKQIQFIPKEITQLQLYQIKPLMSKNQAQIAIPQNSNASTYSVVQGGSAWRLHHTAEPLHIVISIPMQEVFSQPECRMAGWMQLQSSKAFNPYLLSPWPAPGCALETSTSWLEASRAKMSVLQAARWAWCQTQEALCGKKLCELHDSAGTVELNGSSSKMLQASSASDKMESGLLCPNYTGRGMIYDGQLYLAEILRPYIHANAGGAYARKAVLPTPRTSDQQRPLNFMTLNQTMCMNFSEDLISRGDRHALLGHLNSQLSESIMGYALDWTRTIESDVE